MSVDGFIAGLAKKYADTEGDDIDDSNIIWLTALLKEAFAQGFLLGKESQ